MARERPPGFGYLILALLAGAAVVAAKVIQSRVDHPHNLLPALALAGSWAGASFLSGLSFFASGLALHQALRRYRVARRVALLTTLAFALSSALLLVCLA